MRWLSTLVPVWMLWVSLAAAAVDSKSRKTSSPAAAAAVRYEKYFRPAVKSPSTYPIALKDSTYEDLTKQPRDYSAFVLLTALNPRLQCKLCVEFAPEWDLLGRSWLQGDRRGDARVLFGTLDFANGRQTFKKLQLQTAPVLLYFPPTIGPYAAESAEPIRYDFTSGPQTAEHVNGWVARRLPHGPYPSVQRPVDYVRIAAMTTAAVGVLTALVTAFRYLLPILQSRSAWAAVTTVTVVIFSSGHMFNHIRQVPYMVAGKGGQGVVFFSPSFSMQFGLETQIIAAFYGLLAFCVICLASRAPRTEGENAQKFVVVGASAGMFLLYGLLMAIFRMKNSGYPFALPPFF